jgi:hypothetical protein
VLEPAAAPRLAAAAVLAHLGAAASPWIARVPESGAVLLSIVALLALAWTLARVPGRHGALAAVVLDGDGCRIRLAASCEWQPAALGHGSRAYPTLVVLDLRAGGRRFGWLLAPGCLPPDAFRRLKARIRLSC